MGWYEFSFAVQVLLCACSHLQVQADIIDVSNGGTGLNILGEDMPIDPELQAESIAAAEQAAAAAASVDTRKFERWDEDKFQRAFQSIQNAAQEGGRETAIDVVGKLLERGFRPLHIASSAGDISSATAIVDMLRPLHPEIVRVRDADGLTALHHASTTGKTKVMRLLIKKGAQLEMGDKRGSTALHFAAGAGKLQAVKLLVQKGANVEARTAGNATALHVAASAGQVKIIRYLTGKHVGCDLLPRDVHGATPLRVANRTGHENAVHTIRSALQSRIENIYSTYMPEDRKDEVGALLAKFVGSEEELLRHVMHAKQRVDQLVANMHETAQSEVQKENDHDL